MHTHMLENGQKRAFSVRFEPKPEDFSALLVVYEVSEGNWRGFAHPYGETTDGSSKEDAIEKLRGLTNAYHNTLKKYGFPSHLVNGTLTNQMDKTVFNWILSQKDFLEKIHSKAGKADSTYCYVEALRHKA